MVAEKLRKRLGVFIYWGAVKAAGRFMARWHEKKAKGGGATTPHWKGTSPKETSAAIERCTTFFSERFLIFGSLRPIISKTDLEENKTATS